MENVIHKYKKYIPFLLLIGGFLLFSGLGGGYGYKLHKNVLKEQIRKNDSIISASKIKQDSLIELANNQITQADQLREQTNLLQNQNNSLYYELKKRNKKVFIIDRDFMSNARRISNGVNRFYQANDSIR